MKLKLLCLMLLSSAAFSQAVYIEIPPVTTVSGNPPSGSFPTLLAASGAQVSVCDYPACSNLITTYTDATAVTPCPTTAQMVLPGTSTCTNAADSRGNAGFWAVTGGDYQYKITLRNGKIYGPYPVTMQTNNSENVQQRDNQPGAVNRNAWQEFTDRGVMVTQYGATGAGASHDDTDGIQRAWQAACDKGATYGGAYLWFPPTTGYYKITSTLTAPCVGVAWDAPKYVQIRKTGAGDFINVPHNGYGFEVKNINFVGDGTAGAVAIHLSGENIGPFYQGPLNASIHDIWCDGVGSKTVADETAGGCVLVDSQSLNLKFTNSIISGGGYSIRVTTGNDGLKISGLVSNVSRSVAIQAVNTAGAASMEISQNNTGNWGGSIYVFNGGQFNLFGNSGIPGEADPASGPMVKRRWFSTGPLAPSLAEDAGGFSAEYVYISSIALASHENTCNEDASTGSPAGDYCFYDSDYLNPIEASNNKVGGFNIAGFRNGANAHKYTCNRLTGPGTLYSNPIHPGISCATWNGIGTNYFTWGATNGTHPSEHVLPDVASTGGDGQHAVCLRLDRTKCIITGYSALAGGGYIYAWNGTTYEQMLHRSPTLFLGGSGDTAVIIQNGVGQGSKPLMFYTAGGVNDAAVNVDHSATFKAGTGNAVVMQTGAGAPGTNCVAYKEFYTDQISGDLYFCKTTNVWKLVTVAP